MIFFLAHFHYDIATNSFQARISFTVLIYIFNNSPQDMGCTWGCGIHSCFSLVSLYCFQSCYFCASIIPNQRDYYSTASSISSTRVSCYHFYFFKAKTKVESREVLKIDLCPMRIISSYQKLSPFPISASLRVSLFY